MAKAKAFLEYKPEVEHVFVGDYFDSYVASDDDIFETAKMIFESPAIKLWGNHDWMYLHTTHSFMRCSGQRHNPIFMHLMESHKHKLKGAHVADDFIITHAGIHPSLGKLFDSSEIVLLEAYLNGEVEHYLSLPVPPETLSAIWNIGSCRGGWHQWGGIFWADYRMEKLDKRFSQVFGHSHTKSPKLIQVGKAGDTRRLHVCTDCPQFVCFNTATAGMEDFFPEESNVVRHEYERSF
jgi:hypothetical protein